MRGGIQIGPESMGDTTDLSIPFKGSDLITHVASKIMNLLIVVSRRPLDIESQVMEKIYALVVVWLPARTEELLIACLDTMILLAHCL